MNSLMAAAHSNRDVRVICLRLFFASYFAVVLPFICWGAEATPGHPHARSHFVFLEPELAAAPSHVDGDQGHRHGHDAPAADHASSPTGQSTPSVLGVVMLTIVGAGAIALLADDRAGFSIWAPPLTPRLRDLAISTPPPRLTVNLCKYLVNLLRPT
jgi:hypothetical protein